MRGLGPEEKTWIYSISILAAFLIVVLIIAAAASHHAHPAKPSCSSGLKEVITLPEDHSLSPERIVVCKGGYIWRNK